MRTFRKEVSVVFTSVVVFGKVPFNIVSANGLASLQPEETQQGIKSMKREVSKLTGIKGVEGIFASFGTAEDFQHVDVSGKVAVVTRGFISMVEQMKNALAAGAVALVMLFAYSVCNSTEDDEQPNAEHEQNASVQPAVVMERTNEGDDLQAPVALIEREQKQQAVLFQAQQEKKGILKKRRAAGIIERIRSSGRSHDSPCQVSRQSSFSCLARGKTNRHPCILTQDSVA